MADLLQDIRYALRRLARTPGFTAVTILTLALGIGTNSAIFSVINAVLWRPLPYRAPERLMALYSRFPDMGFSRFWISPPEYQTVREMARSFEEMGAYRTTSINVSGKEQPLRVDASYATASLLTTLGVSPELGRFFTPAEDTPNAESVVLLGDGLWRRAFGADRGILGHRIHVDGRDATVVGVMPPGFGIGGQRVEVWLPVRLGPLDPNRWGNHFLYLVARLRPDVSLARAQAEIADVVARWHAVVKSPHGFSPDRHPLILAPLLDDLVGDVRPALRILWAAVGFVLLIACANVANLLLVRAEGRQREVAIRTALGADRTRLLRQFLTESVVLALAGGACGLLLASWGVRALVAANPESIPRLAEIGLDGRSLIFTLVTALATGIAFGLAPALHSRAGSFTAALKDGGQRSTAGASNQSVRRGLVIAEVALAAVLVVGCGLLLRSFRALRHVDPGFHAAGVLTLELSLPETTYKEPRQVADFLDRLTEHLSTLPGVESAAAMNGLPPRREVDANDTEFESVPVDPKGPPHNIDYWQFTTRDYFKTLRIPIRAGRAWSATDTAGSTGVVVINETMAKLFWPGKDPLGQRVRSSGPKVHWLTIVGIAKDVKQGGLDQKTGTELYFLEPQAAANLGDSPRTFHLVVRTAGDPMRLVGPVRAEIRRLDPSLPAARPRPLEQVIDESMARSRFVTFLVSLFAIVALALAAVGTYGVLAYAVEQRTREIGVRMALGAQAREVLAMILRQGLGLVAAGLVLGLLLALGLHRLLASLLFGISSDDPLTFACVALMLSLVALAACYLPARRAAHVQPVIALRSE
ncbi:MAG: ABC transporter permease [Acidobacteriota bacterium]|nr:ABC transporter permease [Acidobacteriota bacterium]